MKLFIKTKKSQRGVNYVTLFFFNVEDFFNKTKKKKCRKNDKLQFLGA